MAITITATGAYVVLDETEGLQNLTATPTPSGDADDNDIASSSLPAEFSARLNNYTLTVDEAALSGFSGGADTGDDILSVTVDQGSVLTDLSFAANSSGDSFTGYGSASTSSYSSGLFTTDGAEIFLFADPTDNNIVYGVAGNTASGDGTDIVFAIYLQEVLNGSGLVTGAKMWTVMMDGYALAHNTDGDTVAAHDDLLDLTNKLFVAGESVLTFEAANAPSGNNLFITFAANDGSGRAIVVTGKAPADQSAGANISTGDTVVTSQVTNTTFGSNDQMLKPRTQQDPDGNGLWFTFVSGTNPSFTVPGLSPTEANVENNIEYTAAFSADEVSFDVVQLQGGTSAKVKISAVNSTNVFAAGGGGDTANSKDEAQYVNGILSDLQGLNDTTVVDITSISVSGAQTATWAVDDTTTKSGISVTWNADGSATLSGVLAGTTISYTTDDDHNRVLIENAGFKGGKTNAAFDIGGFTILSTSTNAVEIGSKVQFEDDGPDVAAKSVAAPTATLDESPLAPAGDGVNTVTITGAAIAALFETPNFGTDGQGSLSYTLSGTDNAQTGLWLTGESGPANEIRLFKISDTQWEGHKGTLAGTLAFTVTMDGSTGAITVTRSSATLEHTTDGSSAADHDDALTMAATANLFAVQHITDGDGDTDSATAANPLTITFEDDGPNVAARNVAAPTATLDESPLTPAGDGVNTVTITGAAIAALFEAPSFGADGQGSLSYTLSGTDNAQTGLWLTGENGAANEIRLFKISDTQWEGHKGTLAGTLAFTVTMDGSSGAVTITRSGATLEHTIDGSTVAAHDDALTVAATANLFAVQHITDGDGDTDSATAANALTIKFEDDGPNVAAMNVAAPTATLDESPVAPAGDGVNTVTIAGSAIAALFETPNFGADGQGSLSYTLSGTNNAQTGLWLTGESGAANEIRLFKISDTQWEGHKGTLAGTLAFTVTMDGSTGAITVTRSSATLEHTTDGSSAADHDDALTMAATANLFAVQHITDGDGDTDSATAANALTIRFEDDGPTVVVEDTSGTYAAGAQGTWNDDDPGSDGFKSLSVSFDSYEIDSNGSQAGTSLTQNGLAFDGSITDDFNGDGIDETVTFTLTFNSANNTYDLDVTSPPSTVITFDTSQGSLAAGGPDAVQTLLFGGNAMGLDDIVFFGVVPTAPSEGGAGASDDLEDLVVLGQTDLTESEIEGLFPIPALINSSTQMNVSTSGIGINNNNLNGANEGAGTGAFAGTTITSGDESFIVNPETVVDKMKVFIDNSVSGYNPATEDLYFTVYFTDGTVQAATKVTAAMLSPVTSGVASGGVSFEIDGGAKQIDAVQLTMGTGTIKIPIIQFSVEQAFAPEPLQLDFTATLFDGDGDSSSDSFSIDLAVA